MKKNIILLCMCMLSITLFIMAGCGSNEKVSTNEKVTINVKLPSLAIDDVVDPEVKSIYQVLNMASAEYEKNHPNVKINVIEYVLTDEVKEIKDSLNTKNAVDVQYGDFFNMVSYIHNGLLVPMDDIISDEMRNDIDSIHWGYGVMEGKTYLMPYLFRQNTLIYNKELFRNAGLESFVSDKKEVQTWTMEEWERILKSLRESLPSGSYPLMMFGLNKVGDMHTITFIKSQGSTIFDENGRFCLEKPEGIAGLQWIRDCMDKRYMPEDAISLAMIDNCNMFLDNKLGIFAVNIAYPAELFQLEKYGMVNFPSITGGISTNYYSGFGVYDNGDPKRIAVAKDFVKFIYESRFLDYSAGNIPCSNKVAKKYADKLINANMFLANKSTDFNFTANNPNWIGVREVFYKIIDDMLIGYKTPAETAKAIDEICNKEIDTGHAESHFHP